MSFRPLRVTRIQHRRREYGAGKRAERGVERRDNDKRGNNDRYGGYKGSRQGAGDRQNGAPQGGEEASAR